MNGQVFDAERIRSAGHLHGYLMGQRALDEMDPEERGAAVLDLEQAVEAGVDVWENLPDAIRESPLRPTVLDLSPVSMPAPELFRDMNSVYNTGFLAGFCEAIDF